MNDVQTLARGRGVTRLCHFTPSRNLSHILVDGEGIHPTRELREDVRGVYHPTDLQRLDGHVGHVCCSVQLPNAWYLHKARGRETLFRDWVVLLLEPHLLWSRDTLFSPRNAAAVGGGLIRPGADGFEAMFIPRIAGAYGRDFVRGRNHPPNAPTDDQAEVLVPGRIPVGDIRGVAVSSEAQAVDEVLRLRLCGHAVAPGFFVVSPLLFDRYGLSEAIRGGSTPGEMPWTC